MDDLQNEMEKAIIGCGQYRLKPLYKFLCVPEETWFKMNTEQRLRHIKKFNSCQVRPQATSSVPSAKDTNPQSDYQESIGVGNFKLNFDSISMHHEEAFANTKVPHATAEGIWSKAAMLIREENAIVVAPGCGPKDKMIKSKSGNAPHLVTTSGNFEYKCDDKCPQFKALAICSHTVAAAQSNSELKEFIAQYRKKHGKQQPHFTQLAVHDMPTAAGRKGGKLPRKKVNRTRVLTNENRVPLKCSQRVNIGESTSNVHPCNNQQSTTNYVTNSHVSTLAVPNLPVAPLPNYNMPFSPCFQNPYYSPQPFGIGGTAVPITMFPSTSLPPALPVPGPQSGPSGLNSSSPNSLLQPTLPTSSSENLFLVCFKFGNVSVCSGCRCNFSRNDELVIKHGEFRSFNSPVTGYPTSKFGNAYYHIKLQCLKFKWPGIRVEEIVVPEDVANHLEDAHKTLLYQELSLQLS